MKREVRQDISEALNWTSKFITASRNDINGDILNARREVAAMLASIKVTPMTALFDFA